MNFFLPHVIYLLCPLLFLPESAYAAELQQNTDRPDWNASTLSGDWGGLRSELYDKGVDLNFAHKSDLLANTSGGLKRGAAWLGHTDAAAKLDMEKISEWTGTTAYVHYHSGLGSKFNSYYAGSFMGVDNIEVSTNTAKFFHAWLQKNFLDDELSLLAGLYPVDSEFYVTDSSGLFMHPSFGMAAEVGQTGLNGPPIFPTSSFGVRVKFASPDHTLYLMAAVNDGVPGDPADPHGTHIKFGKKEGTFTIAELGYTPGETFTKTAIGFWHYTSRFDDLVDTDSVGNPLPRRSQGAYFLAERTLSSEKSDPSQGLAGFFRFGVASADIHQSDWSASLGLRYQGLLPQRDGDIAGIAVSTSHASEKYRLLAGAKSHETVVEASYRAQIKSGLTLQPLVQHIFNPNMDPALDNAWVAGLRLEITF